MTEICVKEKQKRGQKLRYHSTPLTHTKKTKTKKQPSETETFASFKVFNNLKTMLTVSLSVPLLQN